MLSYLSWPDQSSSFAITFQARPDFFQPLYTYICLEQIRWNLCVTINCSLTTSLLIIYFLPLYNSNGYLFSNSNNNNNNNNNHTSGRPHDNDNDGQHPRTCWLLAAAGSLHRFPDSARPHLWFTWVYPGKQVNKWAHGTYTS